jgi:hypothetical protein
MGLFCAQMLTRSIRILCFSLASQNSNTREKKFSTLAVSLKSTKTPLFVKQKKPVEKTQTLSQNIRNILDAMQFAEQLGDVVAHRVRQRRVDDVASVAVMSELSPDGDFAENNKFSHK